jgi:hypothetical protein
MYGKGIHDLEGKLKDVEGTAIRSTFSIQGPPPTAEQKQAREQAVADMKQSSAEREKQDKAQDVTDAASIGTSATKGEDIKGGVGGLLGRKFGNMMAKKVEKSAMKSAEKEPGPLFQSTTEVLSYSLAPAAAGTFEIPAGFKLEKKKKE